MLTEHEIFHALTDMLEVSETFPRLWRDLSYASRLLAAAGVDEARPEDVLVLMEDEEVRESIIALLPADERRRAHYWASRCDEGSAFPLRNRIRLLRAEEAKRAEAAAAAEVADQRDGASAPAEGMPVAAIA